MKANIQQFFYSITMLFSMSILVGCSDDLTDLQAYVEKVQAREPAPIEPIPTIKPYVRFIYPDHENDPFSLGNVRQEVPEAELAIPSVKIDESRPLEFLEKYPLDSLRMVGTVNKEHELWALIQVPSGAVHRVHAGNYIGLNRGRITKIEEARINLLETVDNGAGGFKEQENSIALFDPKSKG